MPLEFADGHGAQALDLKQLNTRHAYHVDSGCLVEPGTDDMTIRCDNGQVMHDGALVSVSAQDNVSLAAAHASHPRKDVVWVNGNGTVQIETGDPEPPVPSAFDRFHTRRPPPPDLISADATVLASVWVQPSATSIRAEDIRDRRQIGGGGGSGGGGGGGTTEMPSGIGGHEQQTADGSTELFTWDSGVDDPDDLHYGTAVAASPAASTDFETLITGTEIGVRYSEPPAPNANLEWYWHVNTAPFVGTTANGTASGTGDGTTALFSIDTGADFTIEWWAVEPTTAAAATDFHTTVDGSQLNIHYAAAPDADAELGWVWIATDGSFAFAGGGTGEVEWQDNGTTVATSAVANLRNNLTVTQGANGEVIIDATGEGGTGEVEWQDDDTAVTTSPIANFRHNLAVSEGVGGKAVVDALAANEDASYITAADEASLPNSARHSALTGAALHDPKAHVHEGDTILPAAISGAVVGRPEAITHLAGNIYVTDDPNEDPTVNDGDIVFYVE